MTHQAMISVFATIKGAAAIVGIALSSILAGGMVNAISEDTHVTIGVAAAVGAAVVGGAWYLSGRLRGIEDKQEHGLREMAEMKKKLEIIASNCPAFKNGNCKDDH
jgi:Na+/melibiose symporter-like transporter